MKFTGIVLGLLFTFAVAGRVSAQIVTYDSLPIDVVLFAWNPDYIDSLEGGADHQQARIGGADFYAVQFVEQGQLASFQKGAFFHIYWTRESSDSCAARLTYIYHDNSGVTSTSSSSFVIFQGGPENIPQMTTIAVPDSDVGENGLQIEVDGNGNAGVPGADSCFIDAIVLVQNGAATVAQNFGSSQPLLQNYPNPFYHASGTRVDVHVPVSGTGLLSVADVLGREVARVPLGELTTGDTQASLPLDRAGVYFVRLLLDGRPYGAPIEISSE